MRPSAPIVIIGAGMAAYSLARELRKLDKATALTIVSADAAGAYAKPTLSNAIALGKGAHQIVSSSAQQMAAQLDAEILPHTRVTAIDPAARTLTLDSGARLAWHALVLATGAHPIRLPMAGDAADEVLSVNHVDDYAILRRRLDEAGPTARVAIIGAGLIGCEFADDLAAGGHHVTLIDPNPRPLAALAAPSLSLRLMRAWEARSVSLRLGTTAIAVNRAGAALALTLADGGVVDADVVISAVGLRPSVTLAQAAGVAVRRGILVDAFGQTSADGIYALGDCAEYTTAGGSSVLPYVTPMLTAARAIAATLAGARTAIELKPDAVIVKTPSLKLALAPPPPGTSGQWVDEEDGERIVARFVDAQGKLHGFGLSAHTPALRAKLLAEL
ncbi:MAG: NAD(P)/FAD-dependent oxidoreductase [Gammaproteobacteria bacterium]